MKALQKVSKFLSDYTSIVVIAIAVVTFFLPSMMGWVNLALFTDMDDFEQGYMVSGYKYGDNGYTVVAINPADHEVVISLALESAQVSGALQGYVTDDTRKWEPVEAVQPADGVYTLTLPARSVVSYIGTVLSSSSL